MEVWMNVLVTGGSRGIGRAIALKLARPGGTVVINYLRNDAAAKETAAEVEARGATAVVVQADVRSEKDLKRLAKAVDTVDVLVHNAAVGGMKPYNKLRTSHWDLTLESSLRPFWLLTVRHHERRRQRDRHQLDGVAPPHSRLHRHGCGRGAGVHDRQSRLSSPPEGRVNTVCGGLIETDTLAYLTEGEKMLEFAGYTARSGQRRRHRRRGRDARLARSTMGHGQALWMGVSLL